MLDQSKLPETPFMFADDEPVAWNELETDELHELLNEEIPGLLPEETAELAELLRAAGGVEEALALIQELASGTQAGKRDAA